MSQLHEFLSILQPNDISKVNKIRIIGVEKKILTLIMNYRNKALPKVESICKDENITPSHFYKICSLLLDKSYNVLVPEKGYKLLEYLNQKDLYRHFTHELLLQEKSEDFEKNNPDLEKFYGNVFLLLQRVSAGDLDEELIDSYGKKYLSAIKNKNEGNEIFVRACFLNTKLNLLKVTKKGVESAHAINKELTYIEEKLINQNYPKASFYVNKAQSTYFHQTVGDPKMVIEYQQKNIHLISKNPTLFENDALVQAECRLAEMFYMDNRFQDAFDAYKKIFSTYKNELESDFYHHSRYAQLAIILEKYSIASELIEAKFGVYIENKKQGPGTMGAILMSKLTLFTNQEQANKYIQLAKRLVNKNLFIQYEYEIRILENIYFALQDDAKSAAIMVKKSLKFMYSKGLTLKNSEMIYVLVLLDEILKPGFEIGNFGIRLDKKYKSLQNSYAVIYGKLITKVIEKYSQN